VNQDIHLTHKTANDGAVLESKAPLSGEPSGRSHRDGLSAAPSPVAGPQPVVELLDNMPDQDAPVEREPDPDWDELTARAMVRMPGETNVEIVERLLGRMGL
jgi:hypothetical protein